MSQSISGILFIFIGTLMWALDTLIRYPLLSSVSAFEIVFLEHFYLTLIFIGYFFYRINLLKKSHAVDSLSFLKMDKKDSISFFVIGCIGSGLSTLAFTKAFYLLNPSVVILLQKLQPIFVILFSIILLKEKLERKFLPLALISLLGAFLISYDDFKEIKVENFFANGVGNEPLALGYVLTLFAVIGWSLSTIFGKRLGRRGFDEISIMAGRFSFGFLSLLFFFLLRIAMNSFDAVDFMNFSDIANSKTILFSADTQLKIILMVLLSGILGMYFYYKGLNRVSAHVSSMAELFFPLSVVIINWIFLNQTLSVVQIIGAILMVLASVGLAHLQKSSRLQQN